MAKDMKTRKGKDNIYYPYTSPDIVVDSTGESQTTKNNNMQTDINTIKTDLGTAQLTTTAQDIRGAVNEVVVQYKDIENNVGLKREYIEAQQGQTDALEVVANDTASLTATQIKLNEANKYGGRFTIGNYVKYQESTGINNKLDTHDSIIKNKAEYPILTGEVGVIDVTKPYSNVERYGAIGNGIVDDTVALTNALNFNKRVELGNNKSYLVSNNLPLTAHIEGNNSTIFINDSYNKTNTTYALFSPLNPIENVIINNLKIECMNKNSLYIRGDKSSSYYIINTHTINNRIKTIEINNVNISTPALEDCFHIALLTCEKIIIRNCNFINNTKGMTGGCVYIHSDKNDITFSIENSKFINYSSDEIFACYGKNNILGKISTTNFSMNNDKLLKRTLPISIYSEEENNTNNINVNFSNCNIYCHNDHSQSFILVCCIGVGSVSEESNTSVTFSDCNIKSELKSTVFRQHFSQSNYSNVNFVNNKDLITIKNCNIESDSTINGSTMHTNFGNDIVMAGPPCSMIISDSYLKCYKALFIDTNLNSTKSTLFSVSNTNIEVINPFNSLMWSYYKNNISILKLDNVIVNGTGITDILTSRDEIRPTNNLMVNVKDTQIYKNVILNGTVVADSIKSSDIISS